MTSTTARSDGASITSSTNVSRSYRPLSPPTSFMRAPGRAIEDPRVRGVHQVETHNLSRGRFADELRLAVDEHDVAEPTHRREVRARAAEGRNATLFDEEVVKCERNLAIDGGPVRRVGRF